MSDQHSGQPPHEGLTAREQRRRDVVASGLGLIAVPKNSAPPGSAAPRGPEGMVIGQTELPRSNSSVESNAPPSDPAINMGLITSAPAGEASPGRHESPAIGSGLEPLPHQVRQPDPGSVAIGTLGYVPQGRPIVRPGRDNI